MIIKIKDSHRSQVLQNQLLPARDSCTSKVWRSFFNLGATRSPLSTANLRKKLELYPSFCSQALKQPGRK